MPNPKDEYKGIKCMNPECPAVNDVKCGQMKKSQDYITRPKTCKNCGTIYNTVEVPVCIVEIHNNHLGNAAPVADAAPDAEAAPVVSLLPETPPAAVAALVTEVAPPAIVAPVEAPAVAGTTTVPPPPAVALT